MPPESDQNLPQADQRPADNSFASGGAGTTISPTTSQSGESSDATPTPAGVPDSPAPTPSTPPGAPSNGNPQVFGPAMPFAEDAVSGANPHPASVTSFSPFASKQPTAGSAPAAPTPSASPPLAPSAAGVTPPGQPAVNGNAMGSSKRHMPALLLVIASVLVLVLGGSAAAYFGYYMSPTTVWKDSLTNTGKGYDQLVSYLNTQSSAHYNGIKEDGSFQISSAGLNFNGSVSGQSYKNSSTASVKFDLGVTKLDLEARTVPATGSNGSDIYFQLTGIKELGAYLGTDLGPKVNSLDGQWIVVDHNLIADLEQQLIKQQGAKAQLKWSDINSFLVSASQVNKQYLFTTDANKSVTTIVKTYGKETVDGHKTIHYKVGFVKAHVKAYATAMCSALAQSGLGAYIKKQTGQAVTDSSTCKDIERSTDNIKASDTVDVWADTAHRIFYKVRVSDPSNNPAQNFVDVGLNYTGGTSYPFFIAEQNKDSSNTGSFSVVATLDSKANTLKAVVKGSDRGDSAFTLNGNFSLAPSNQKLTITAPANAKPITDVINSLGLSQYLNELQALSSGGTSGLPANTPLIPSTTQI